MTRKSGMCLPGIRPVKGDRPRFNSLTPFSHKEGSIRLISYPKLEARTDKILILVGKRL